MLLCYDCAKHVDADDFTGMGYKPGKEKVCEGCHKLTSFAVDVPDERSLKLEVALAIEEHSKERPSR